MMSKDTLLLFRDLIIEKSLPLSHPQFFDMAKKFNNALLEIHAELSKPEGIVDDANGSSSSS
jgi:hypothetical protein